MAAEIKKIIKDFPQFTKLNGNINTIELFTMRYLLFIYFIFFGFAQAKSQQSEVVSITTKDRIFEGTIGDSYPITMYLKAVKRSENNGLTQSVTGWYSYNKVGTPIPLAGLIGPGMHLVSSNTPQVLYHIEDFKYETGEYLLPLDSYINEIANNMANIEDVTERFELDYDGNQIIGTWEGNGETLKAELFAKDYRISKTRHFLRHPNGEFFDLEYLGLPDWASIEVEASANNGKNVILDYYFQANLNYLGRCGAAENKGKVELVFNRNYKLIKSSFVIFEDCYRSIYILEEDPISDTVTEYQIEYSEGSDNPEYVYFTVDLQQATITRK